MGLWFTSSALGLKLAGMVGTQWELVPHSTYFAGVAALPLLAVVALLPLVRWLNRQLPDEVR